MGTVRSILKVIPLILLMGCSNGGNSNRELMVQDKPQLTKVHIKSLINIPIKCNDKEIETIITTPDDLKRIQSEIEKLELFSKDLTIGKNMGFISIYCYYSNGDEIEYAMIYTVYYGVIVQKTKNHFVDPNYYKNNDLEKLIIKYCPEALKGIAACCIEIGTMHA